MDLFSMNLSNPLLKPAAITTSSSSELVMPTRIDSYKRRLGRALVVGIHSGELLRLSVSASRRARFGARGCTVCRQNALLFMRTGPLARSSGVSPDLCLQSPQSSWGHRYPGSWLLVL